MTGVYIGEVCLLGLFAINTAPGPIVLQAIFLGFTVVFHVSMHAALRPLTKELPDTLAADDALYQFSRNDDRTYELGTGLPSDSAITEPKGLGAAKAKLFRLIFNNRIFDTKEEFTENIPDHAPPVYTAEEHNIAYYDPSVRAQVPRLWIVKDIHGFSAEAVKEDSKVLPITDEFAFFNEKGKVVWAEENHEKLDMMPIYEKRVDY